MNVHDRAYPTKLRPLKNQHGFNFPERKETMIRNSTDHDFEEIYEIINDAAQAYKGIIPPDRWHEPYMTKEELKDQIREGVRFKCFVEEGKIIGVMGIQDKIKVDLIRHAYVRTTMRKKGIGSVLLRELTQDSKKPILIGTWRDAKWAISFYEKNGFYLVPDSEKNRLLRMFWKIPERQVETSVVLANVRKTDF